MTVANIGTIPVDSVAGNVFYIDHGLNVRRAMLIMNHRIELQMSVRNAWIFEYKSDMATSHISTYSRDTS